MSTVLLLSTKAVGEPETALFWLVLVGFLLGCFLVDVAMMELLGGIVNALLPADTVMLNATGVSVDRADTAGEIGRLMRLGQAI